MTDVLARKTQKGQSVSEFIVTMAVLVPLLLVMASFANLLTLNTETVEAGRLAAWQRTVYKESDEFGVDDAYIRDEIADSINEVYLQKNYTDFGPGKALNTTALPSLVDRSVNGGPVSVRTPTPTEIDGIAMVNNNTRLVQSLGEALTNSATLQSPEVSIAIDSDYSLLKAVKLTGYRTATYENPENLPFDRVAGRNQFHTSSRAALIADGWMPGSSSNFAAVTSSVAFDEDGLKAFQGGDGLLSPYRVFDFFGFDEVEAVTRNRDGYTTSSDTQDSILPSDL